MASKQNKWKPNFFRWAFALSVGAIAYFAAQPYGARAPLGAPLPEYSVLIEYEGIEYDDSSLLTGRLNERLLELLGPQPDGVPPLNRPYTSKSAGFTIGHPFGTQMTIFLQQNFMQDQVLSQAFLWDGMPLKAIKYILPEKEEGDKVTVHVSRVRKELEAKDANFLAPQGVVELADYRFETLEYEMVDESGELRTHFVFFGPFGPRILTIDFIALEGMHAQAIPYVDKIIRSFEPGEQLLDLIEETSQAGPVNIEAGAEDNRNSGDV